MVFAVRLLASSPFRFAARWPTLCATVSPFVSRFQEGRLRGDGEFGCASLSSRRHFADAGGFDDPNFEKYNEIDNASLSRVQPLRTSNTDEWIATEKVHGANFGIYVLNKGAQVRFAKRTTIMPETEPFFGYQCIAPQLKEQALKIRELVMQDVKQDPDTIIIYGELFGGKYLHPEVPRSSQSYTLRGATRGVSSVQKEPFPQYTPNLAFYAYDIKYKVLADGAMRTMTFDEATNVFKRIPGLLYQRAIVRGHIDKCLAFNVETFLTTVPQWLGLSEYYMKHNKAEGVVIRHAKRGLPEMEARTTMLKIKCTAFQEMKADRTQMTAPRAAKDPMLDVRMLAIQRVGPQLAAMDSVLPTPELVEHCQKLSDHICDSRLSGLLSKLGTDGLVTGALTQKRLAHMLAQDALKDFLKEAPPTVINAPVVIRREFARYLLTEARRFVAAGWKALLENAAPLAPGGRLPAVGSDAAPDDGAAAASGAGVLGTNFA